MTNVIVNEDGDLTITVSDVGVKGDPGDQHVYAQSTAPSSPNENDIWIETP